MSTVSLEIGNFIVITVTSLATYFISANLSMLLIIPAIGFQIYVFQKYYESHKAEAEYRYAVIAVILFVLAYFFPQYMMPLLALGCLNLSRVGITLYSLGEKEESSKLINQALYEAQLNMQKRMEENYKLLQKEMPKASTLSEAEIRARLEKIKEVLSAEQKRKISELENRYSAQVAQLKTKDQNSLAQLNALLEQKNREISSLKQKTDSIMTNYLEEYKKKIEEQNRKINALAKENKEQAQTIKQQKSIIDQLLAKQDDYIAQIEKQNHSTDNMIISNNEIHAKLLTVLREAKEEVDIMSPWINNNIVNSVFEDRLDMLVRKGGKLKVVYGIGNKGDDPKQKRAEKILNRLQQKYGSQYIKYKYFSSHSKLIICDDRYYIITSCNPLSNDGMRWEEIGEISTNKENLLAYRKKYFSDF